MKFLLLSLTLLCTQAHSMWSNNQLQVGKKQNIMFHVQNKTDDIAYYAIFRYSDSYGVAGTQLIQDIKANTNYTITLSDFRSEFQTGCSVWPIGIYCLVDNNDIYGGYTQVYTDVSFGETIVISKNKEKIELTNLSKQQVAPLQITEQQIVEKEDEKTQAAQNILKQMSDFSSLYGAAYSGGSFSLTHNDLTRYRTLIDQLEELDLEGFNGSITYHIKMYNDLCGKIKSYNNRAFSKNF